jgi:hypothetical protein
MAGIAEIASRLISTLWGVLDLGSIFASLSYRCLILARSWSCRFLVGSECQHDDLARSYRAFDLQPAQCESRQHTTRRSQNLISLSKGLVFVAASQFPVPYVGHTFSINWGHWWLKLCASWLLPRAASEYHPPHHPTSASCSATSQSSCIWELRTAMVNYSSHGRMSLRCRYVCGEASTSRQHRRQTS